MVAYIECLRWERALDQSPRSEAAAEHHRQKAKLVAYETARYAREHILFEAHEHLVMTMTGVFLSWLSQLAAHMVGPNHLLARRKWEANVIDVREVRRHGNSAEEAERNDRRPAG